VCEPQNRPLQVAGPIAPTHEVNSSHISLCLTSGILTTVFVQSVLRYPSTGLAQLLCPQISGVMELREFGLVGPSVLQPIWLVHLPIHPRITLLPQVRYPALQFLCKQSQWKTDFHFITNNASLGHFGPFPLFTGDTNPAMPTGIVQQKRFSGSMDGGISGAFYALFLYNASLNDVPVCPTGSALYNLALKRARASIHSVGRICCSRHNLRLPSKSTTRRFKIPSTRSMRSYSQHHNTP